MRRDAKANRDTDVAESGVDAFAGALAREVLLERGLVAPYRKAEADGDHQHTVDKKKPSRDFAKTNEQHEEPHFDAYRGTLSDDLRRGNDRPSWDGRAVLPCQLIFSDPRTFPGFILLPDVHLAFLSRIGQPKLLTHPRHFERTILPA